MTGEHVPNDGDTLPPNVVNVVNDVELTDDPGDPDGNTVIAKINRTIPIKFARQVRENYTYVLDV